MSCGKKGPPRPPRRPLPPAVQDLRHSVHGNVVELRWTLAGAAGRGASPAAAVKVFRAAQSDEDLGCKTCPIRFAVVGEIPIHDKAPEHAESGALRFTEVVEPGYRYSYKVIVFDKYGIGGKDSNIVEFDH